MLIVLLKTVVAFGLLLTSVIFMIWFERKLISDFQNRVGPNKAGPWGLLQTLADGLKLIMKEDLIPDRADRKVFILAPFLSAVPAFVTFSIVPIAGGFDGEKFGAVSLFGHDTYVQLADPPIGVLLLLAMSSIAIYGVMLAGWASGSKWPLLGAVRGTAQMVSYEAALGLAVVAVVLLSGSLSTHDIVVAQSGSGYELFGSIGIPRWNLIATGVVPFVIFLIAAHGRAQPSALRPRRGRAGAGRRLPDRVLVVPLRPLLPGRVHEHDHDVGHHRDPVLRRPGGPGPVRAARVAVGPRSGSR